MLLDAIRVSARAGYCLRVVALVALLLSNVTPAIAASHDAASLFDTRASAARDQSGRRLAQAAPAVAATKTDRLLIDRDGDGKADPGDTLRYTVVVSNTGATDASGMTFDDPLDRNVTLAPGSIETTPLALGQATTTIEDTPLPLTLGASDADGDLLTFTVLNAPAHGTLSGTGPNRIYNPAADYNGADSLTFQVCDTSVPTACDNATVALTISSVNDGPDVLSDTFTLAEDTILTGTSVLANDSDAHGGAPGESNTPLTAQLAASPAHAASFQLNANGTFVYTPTANFFGTDSFTYRALDALGAASATASVTLNVTNVNDNPTAVDDSATVAEDSAATPIDVLANDTATPDVGETLTISAVGKPSSGSTAIISASTSLSYTPAPSFQGTDIFSYTISDGNGGSDTAAITVTVTRVNDPPSFTKGADQTVLEDAGPQTVNGWATNISPGPPDEATQTVSFNVTGNTNPGLFSTAPAISPAGDLTYTPAPNANGTATITVTLQDNGGTAGGGIDTSAPQSFTITVTPVNDAPTALALSNSSVAEGQPSGALVGSFTTIDPDAGDTHTYSLVAGAGSTDNSSFQIVGNQLQTAAVLDFETKSSYSIRVRTTDAGGLFFEQQFTITITNANDAPTALALGNSSVAENQPLGTTVGTFTTTDPDAGDTHTYTLVAGTGSTDNGSFQIVGNQLQTNAVFDFETKSSYSIRVRTTDAGGLSFEQQSTITITNANEAPTALALGNSSVAENQPSGTAVGTFSTTDPDAGDTHTYTLVAGTGSADNASFQIVGNQLQTAASFDFETKSSYSIRVRATDSGGLFFEQQFTITIINANDPPIVTAGAGSPTFTEDGGPVAVDAALTVTDPDNVNLASATVTIANLLDAGAETLAANTAGTSITASYSAPVLTLTGSDTVAHYQQVLRSVTYNNSSQNPNTTARNIAFVANDGSLNSNTLTKALTVVAVNDAPVLAGAGTVTFTEDGGAVVVVSALTASDVDNANLASASVTIANLLDTGAETLAANTAGTSITASYSAPVLTLSGSDTVARYQQVLRSVTYNNSSQNPNPTARSVAFVVNDSAANSNTATATVNVVPVNDAPVLTTNPISYSTAGNTQLHVAGATRAGVASIADAQSALAKANPTDVDGPVVPSIVAASGTSANGGSFSIAADGSFTYVPPAGFTGADSFTYQVTDSQTPTTGMINISVSQVVWYVRDVVDANNPAGGNGTSANAFDTLAQLNAATTNANDIIFVFAGNTASTPLVGGVTLKDGQKLWGEGIGLTVAPFGTIVAAGSQPRINNGAGDAVSVPATAGSRTNVEIRGLDLQGSGNAIDVTASGANSASVTISNNTVRGAGVEGIDVNAASSGTVTVDVQNNALTATGNAFDARSTAGALQVTFSNNANITSNATGVLIDGSGGGTTTITGFANNSVHQNTAGTGISVSSARFDATPGGSFQTVSGGTTTIGASGNGVGGAGIVLTNVTGDLSFTDLDIFADGGAGLQASSSGTFNAAAGTGFQIAVGAGVGVIEAIGGPAVNITAATVNLQLTSLKSTNSATTGVSLDTVAGTFSAGSGSSITNATGTDFNINAGAANVTYNGTITDTTGRLVSVTNTTGGTKSFTGAISDTGSGSGQGISLTNNTGATISFSGGLTLSTGANAAFAATGGGTVNVTGSTNTLATTTGTALNVANTTIGASGLTFRSISSNGTTNGIVLNNTGSGGLTVTGNTAGNCGGNVTNSGATVTAPVTADCSGGTILNSTGTGILLTSASNISLTRMRIAGSADDGIGGTTVSGLTLTSSLIENNGNAVGDRGIDVTNLTGSGGIATSTIRGSKEHNIIIANTSGNLTAFNVTNSQIATNDLTPTTGTGDDGIQILNNGTGSMAISVTQSAFTDNKGDHFQAASSASATGSITAVFSNNTLITTAANDPQVVGGGITINPGNAADITFTISNNNIQQAFDDSININHDPSSTAASNLEGTISGNTIGTAGDVGSGSESSNAITLGLKGAGTNTIAVTNNTIREWGNQYCIFVGISEGSASANTTVTNNNCSVTFPNVLIINGIRVDAGATAGPPVDNGTLCVTLTGNNVTGAGNAANGDADIRLRQRFSTTIRLPGYGGANNDTTAVNNFVAANNDPAGATPAPTVSSAQNVGGGGGGFVGGAACTTPIAMAPSSDQFLAQNHITTNSIANVQAVSANRNPASAFTATFHGGSLFKQTAWVKPQGTTVNASTALLTGSQGSGAVKPFAPPLAPPQQAGSFPLNIGTLPAGKRVTITFDVVIASPLPAGVTQVSNQARVTGGNFAAVLTDDPDTAATADPTITQLDTTATTFRTYLPVVTASGAVATAPDLVITGISLVPNKLTFKAGEPVEVRVTVKNQGGTAAGPFWLDLYINPSSAPTAANQIWNTRCGLTPCFGMAWEVTSGLAPGQSITLSSLSLPAGYSIWPGYFAAGTTDLYTYADSYNPSVVVGAVAESDESNNRAELHGLSVTGPNPALMGPQGVTDLPTRPIHLRR